MKLHRGQRRRFVCVASAASRLLLIAFASCVAIAAQASASLESKMQNYLASTTATLPKFVDDTLVDIKGDRRRLLAITIYLRAGSTLESRWSWSQAQIDTYEKSTDYADVLKEVAKVATQFAQENPGYTLYANTNVRSIELQIKRWNETESVARDADEVWQAATKELEKISYPLHPDVNALSKFETFAAQWHASRPPTLAAPGMSLHGRGRAFDFQIQKAGRTIAGADSTLIKSVWDAQGWTKKLSTAVNAASNKFVGPLVMPREPWHYEYRR